MVVITIIIIIIIIITIIIIIIIIIIINRLCQLHPSEKEKKHRKNTTPTFIKSPFPSGLPNSDCSTFRTLSTAWWWFAMEKLGVSKTTGVLVFGIYGICTVPETNSSHLKVGHPKRKQSYSNCPFSAAVLVWREGILKTWKSPQIAKKRKMFKKTNWICSIPKVILRKMVDLFFWGGVWVPLDFETFPMSPCHRPELWCLGPPGHFYPPKSEIRLAMIRAYENRWFLLIRPEFLSRPVLRRVR